MEGQAAAAVGRRPLERRFEQHRLHRQLEVQAYARLVPQPTVALRQGETPRRQDRTAERPMERVAS